MITSKPIHCTSISASPSPKSTIEYPPSPVVLSTTCSKLSGKLWNFKTNLGHHAMCVAKIVLHEVDQATQPYKAAVCRAEGWNLESITHSIFLTRLVLTGLGPSKPIVVQCTDSIPSRGCPGNTACAWKISTGSGRTRSDLKQIFGQLNMLIVIRIETI